jgi:spore coat protein U-like protein
MSDRNGVRTIGVRTLFFIRCIFVLCFLLLGNEVWAACTVSTTSTAFGNYDVLSATPTDTTGTVTIACTRRRNFNYTVVVSIGPGYNNNINPRTMHLTDLLNYYLYTNAARTTVWGNGTSGTVTQTVNLAGPANAHASQNLTAYGRIPTGQNVSIGAYADNLTVTITF